jgi:hypothetical protein
MIEVEGEKYKCVETLGYQQVGMPTKVLLTVDGERIAVKSGGKWTWWSVSDKLSKPRKEIEEFHNILM